MSSFELEESSFSFGSGSGSSFGAANSAGFSSFSFSNSALSASAGGSAESVAEAAVAASVQAAAASLGGASLNYVSEVEQAILRSGEPLVINESEEISVFGNRGIWANRAEVAAWKGVVPISSYAINQDSSPEIISKKSSASLEYVQELAVRYLRPPTPPPPGEIIIVQEANAPTAPAPPLVIRQQPPRPSTPEPLVVREAPPAAPAAVGRKLITISGRRIPPPPRKVIIERLAPLPSKPQSVLIERWLPYSEAKRRVVFRKSNQRDPVVVKPRNVIVQWQAPSVSVRKEIKYLGVVRANPADYVQRYGSSLLVAASLPAYVRDIAAPDGLVLAANHRARALLELEGDVAALGLIDLDRNGLSEYRAYLSGLGVSAASAAAAFGLSASSASAEISGASASSVQYGLSSSGASASSFGLGGASSSSFEFSSSSSSSSGGAGGFLLLEESF